MGQYQNLRTPTQDINTTTDQALTINIPFQSQPETSIDNMAATSKNAFKILVINPNSNQQMTEGLKDLINSLHFDSKSTIIETYTAPSGPNSINNEEDAEETKKIILEDFERRPQLSGYDGYVVACYSQHPLVEALRIRFEKERGKKVVLGIFESSISHSLTICFMSGLFHSGKPWGRKFAIVTTGKAWVPLLTKGVNDYLGVGDGSETEISHTAVFKGVESTGFNADELHTAPEAEVRKKMIEATTRLVKEREVGAVVLGCAGMAGMDQIVRQACVEALGEVDGRKIAVVDGVKAGIAMADGLLRSS